MRIRSLRIQFVPGGLLRPHERVGVAVVVIVIVLLAIALAAGAAGYYFLVARPGTPAPSKGSTSSETSSSDTLTTTSSLTSSTRSSSASGEKYYSGTFQFTLPGIPSGSTTNSTGGPVEYSSVLVGSGSFTFSVSSANESGSGSGHATLTVTTTGFCSGQTSFPYTFKIPDATTILGNLTVFFSSETPLNYTVPLTCMAEPNQVFSTPNSWGYLPVYPNEVMVSSVPETLSPPPSAGISYTITIAPAD